MFAVLYLYYKLTPENGGFGLVLFLIGGTLTGVIALISLGMLVARWSRLTRAERYRLAFYALFV